MHSIIVEVPEKIFSKAEKIAQSRHVTVEQLITEQFFTLVELYWEERSKNITRAEYEAVLQRIPRTEPDEFDKL